MSGPGAAAAPLGWGVVGFGWVARDFAAPAIAAAGHRLAAVFDPSDEARAAARAMGASAHDSLDALLADPAVEAVYVATPNHRHRGPVEACAAAGRPVLCEKPMAASLADAEAMAAAVARAGTLYGTAFDQRHHPAHAAVRAAVAGGAVGTVTALRIAYCCWLAPGWLPPGAVENWRADPAKAGGGALMDLAPHGLDLAEFLLGEPVAEVRALTQRRVHPYGVDDGALVIGATASGVLVSLHVAYNHPETLPRRRLEVVGTGGLITAIDTMGQDAGGAVTLTEAASGVARPLPFEAALSPFTAQIAAFSRAVRGDAAAALFSAARDLGTMRLLARAYDSAGEGAVPAARVA